jgi:hypothetical protein
MYPCVSFEVLESQVSFSVVRSVLLMDKDEYNEMNFNELTQTER